MSSYSDYAANIGRLQQQQGEILARAELAKGAARSNAQSNTAALWGQTIGNLGQIPGQVIAQQAQTKELQLREQEQQLRNQALQGQVKAQEQQRITSAQANQIVATFPRNPDNTYNVIGIQGKLAEIGIPLEQQKGVLDVIEGMNKIATSFNASKIDHAADAAHLLMSQHPAGQPWAWADVQLSAAGLKPTGLVSDEDQKLIDQAAESGANPEAFLKAMRDKSPKYKDVEKDAAALRKATADATVAEQVAAGTKGGLTPEQQAVNQRAADAAAVAAANQRAAQENIRRDNDRADKQLGISAAQLKLAQDKAKGDASANQLAGAGVPDVPPGQKNEEFLKTLPAAQQSQVKALAEGRMAFPSGAALRAGYWQQMLQAVGKYDPSFDAVNYNARSKTRADFTSGKSAANVNALNTVLGHLSDLSDAADALKNSNYPLYNSVANTLSKAVGSKTVTNFETIKKAVADEVTKVWRQTGGTQHDIEAAEGNLLASNSPEQLHGAIATYGHLLESKLDSLNDQYRQGMGTDKIDILTPKATSALTKIEQRAGEPTYSVSAGGKTYTFPTQKQADQFKQAAGVK